jgi:hypothetical protein
MVTPTVSVALLRDRVETGFAKLDENFVAVSLFGQVDLPEWLELKTLPIPRTRT